MKPRLKPVKGWKYRIIICDQEGVVAFDDANAKPVLPVMVESMIKKWRDY